MTAIGFACMTVILAISSIAITLIRKINGMRHDQCHDMRINDIYRHMNNRILELPAEAYFNHELYYPKELNRKPKPIYIDDMNDDDWEELYNKIRIQYKCYECARSAGMHFSIVPCKHSKFITTPCFCVKTKAWHMPYDLDAACRKGGNE